MRYRVQTKKDVNLNNAQIGLMAAKRQAVDGQRPTIKIGCVTSPLFYFMSDNFADKKLDYSKGFGYCHTMCQLKS